MRYTKILKPDEACKDFDSVVHSFKQEQNSSLNCLYKSLMNRTPKMGWDILINHFPIQFLFAIGQNIWISKIYTTSWLIHQLSYMSKKIRIRRKYNSMILVCRNQNMKVYFYLQMWVSGMKKQVLIAEDGPVCCGNTSIDSSVSISNCADATELHWLPFFPSNWKQICFIGKPCHSQ